MNHYADSKFITKQGFEVKESHNTVIKLNMEISSNFMEKISKNKNTKQNDDTDDLIMKDSQEKKKKQNNDKDDLKMKDSQEYDKSLSFYSK